jgi:hypothetical protein
MASLLAGGRGRWQNSAVAVADDQVRKALLRRGFALEYTTLGWNVAGIVVLAIAAISARSVALAGFALDSLIEIGASTVVIWELSGTGEQRQRRGLVCAGGGSGCAAGRCVPPLLGLSSAAIRAPRRSRLRKCDELAEERPGGWCVEPVVEAVRHAGLVGLQRDDSGEHVAVAGVEEDRAA